MRMTKNARPRSQRPDAGLRSARRTMSRRLALVGTVVVLGLTACGSPDGASNASPSSTVPAPAVIQVAGAATGRGAAPMAAADATAESTKMMPGSLTYTWTGDAPDLTSSAASWFFPAGVEPTEEQVRAIAAAFGVTGDVVELGADMGGGWTVGPNDGTAPSITVAPDAMGSWWFSPAWATTEPMVDCAYYPPGDPAADPTTAEMPVCDEPQPPANVPTKAEAEAKARELFSSLGLDPAQFQYETYADEWSANVSAFLVLDGVRTNVSANVGYGGDGEITWAGGFLATPQRGADYPRIGVEAAIERLNDQSAMWMSGAGPLAREGVAMAATDVVSAESGSESVSVGAATEAAPPATDAGAYEEPAPTDTTGSDPAGDVAPIAPDASIAIDPIDCTDPAVSCLPVEPMEPIVIDLSSVESSLEQVWAADGTVWLLPGYLFSGADGAMASVVAIEDQYLEQSDPAPVPLPEPMPVETAVPGTEVVTPDQPGASEGEPAPEFDLFITGLRLDEATKLAAESGWTVRVTRENGVDLAVTMDYSETRVNVAVEDGQVTDVLSVG